MKALGEAAVPEVRLLPEWLTEWLDERAPAGLALDAPGYRLLAHCTEKTNAPGTPKAWQRVFAAFGLELEVVASGCCGMSGTYGHETRNLNTSKVIYSQSWQPIVENLANTGRLLATGYSCRSQARRISGTILPHPLQALLGELRRVES